MSQLLQPLDFPLHGSRLIEASAGTGKTWTIAALYLRLVLGHGGENAFHRPLVPSEILVMTFTRAATRELSDRIRERLVEAAACFRGERAVPNDDALLRALFNSYHNDEERKSAAWRLALAAECMDEAAIYTIDAWCQRMLREHAFDSGCLFDEKLEPDELRLQMNAARDYWRQQCYPLTRDALETVVSIWPDPDALLSATRNLYQEAISSPESAVSLGELIERTHREREAALTSLAQGWSTRARDFEGWLEGQLVNNKTAWNGRKLQARYYAPWFQTLRQWAENPVDGLEKALGSGAFRLTPVGLADAAKDGSDVPVPPESAALEELLDALSGLPSISAAIGLHATTRIQQRLALLKRQSGTFGFSDMLHRLDQALAGENGGVLRERALKQYPVAMIDEFQDTSPLQYALFDRIYRTQNNDPAYGFFLIGDPKQSIYGFRGADIRSYLRARSETEGRHYALGTNYRSTAELVSAVNSWFHAAEQRPGPGAFLFRTPEEEGGYNPLPFEAVTAKGRSERFVVGAQPIPAMTVAWYPDDSGVPHLANDLKAHLAECCAEQIVQWLNDESAGFSENGAKFARIRPNDIAILVRTGREADLIRRKLQVRGVTSVYLSDNESVFASVEAKDLIAWLKAVAAPLDARAARAALATSLLARSMEELIAMSSNDAVFDSNTEVLQHLHMVWQQQGILAMLRQSLHRMGLPARWLGTAGGERRLTNFLHLAELLQGSSAESDGMQSLIRWLSAQYGSSERAAEGKVVRLESDSDLVRVVTVHKSKGLEYPVVLLPFAADFRAVKRDGTPFLWIHGTDGQRTLSFDYGDDELVAADNDRLQEDLRLLYVALTRARHALWIGLGPLRKGKNPACVNEHGAAGNLMAGSGSLSPVEWRARVDALVESNPHIRCVEVSASIAVTTLLPRDQGNTLKEARLYTGRFDRWWAIGSFSSLTRSKVAPLPLNALESLSLLTGEHRGAEDDAQAAAVEQVRPRRKLQAAERDGVDQPWHRFPRGAAVGNFVHDQLEWLCEEDFRLEPNGSGELADRLRSRCKREGRADQSDDLVAWMSAVVHRPLGLVGCCLAEVSGACAEMEFWLPVSSLLPDQFNSFCQKHILAGRPRAALSARRLQGMLMGFIDLVFERGGRYWVLDYKTNYLGADGSAYDEASMASAMLENRYDVQSAIYLFALHRLLQRRLGDSYDPEAHLGGAIYFFLRGIDGPEGGIHVQPASPAMLQELDGLFNASAVTAVSA